jgi:uncharacterized protein
MLNRIVRLFQKDEQCTAHASQHRTVNRALWSMIIASGILIAWHVWTFGPSGHASATVPDATSFLHDLVYEIRDLFFSPHGVLAELRDVLPYFFAGILLAGYLRTYKIALKLQASLKKYGVASVFLASFIGIISPLCACGTITTAVSLLFAGLPLAPVMALMVTSPLLSPSAYLLTLNDLGPEWTAIRTLSALSMGIFAGLITHLLRNHGFQTKEVFIEGAIVRGDFHDEDYPDERLRCNCREKFGNRVAVRTNSNFLIFLAKSSEMLWPVGKYILVGVIIGSIVERYMPVAWIYRFFGQNDPLNILWVTLASVPVFLHQLSASSILYHIKGSLNGTLDGGSALAFMIGGPVTAIPTMIMFWSIFKKRVFFLYIFVCIGGTLLIAYSFQYFVFVPGVDIGNPLFKGVVAVSGGRSAGVVKQDKDVRIALANGGKNIIATYANDINNRGGVVFDSGFDRYIQAGSPTLDNHSYITNTAEWLEQNNRSDLKRSILIYETGTSSGRSAGTAGHSIEKSLQNSGNALQVVQRAAAPVLSADLLNRYGQVWILVADDGSGTAVFSNSERAAISAYAEKGCSILLAVEKKAGSDASITAANQLASGLGVSFSGEVTSGAELPVSIAAGYLAKSSDWIGSLLKIFSKA